MRCVDGLAGELDVTIGVVRFPVIPMPQAAASPYPEGTRWVPREQYLLHNYQRPEDVRELTRLLTRKTVGDERLPQVLLSGARKSGRHYLLQSALWHAGSQPFPIRNSVLDVSGYDANAETYEQYCGKRELLFEGPRRTRWREIAAWLSTYTALKVTSPAIPLLMSSIGLELELPLRDLFQLFGSVDWVTKPGVGGDGEFVERIFRKLTEDGNRFVLFVPGTRQLGLDMRRYLQHAWMRVPNFVLVHTCAPEDGNHDVVRTDETRRFELRPLEAFDLRQHFERRFGPSPGTAGSLDFLTEQVMRHSGGHPGEVAKISRALADNLGMLDRLEQWHLPDAAQLREGMAEVLRHKVTADLEEALDALPAEDAIFFRRFFWTASFCGEWFPADDILAFLEVSGKEERDEWIDFLDGHFGAIAVELGWKHAYLPDHLLYRFAEPLLPGACLRMDYANRRKTALQLARFLHHRLGHETSSKADLLLNVLSYAGECDQTEELYKALSWRVDRRSAAILRDALIGDLRSRRVAPEAVLEQVERLYRSGHPPVLLLAALDALIATQRWVPLSHAHILSFCYHHSLVLGLMGETHAALDAARRGLEFAGTDTVGAIRFHHRLGELQQGLADWDASRTSYEQARYLILRLRGNDDPDLRLPLTGLARLELELKNHSAAMSHVLAAIACGERHQLRDAMQGAALHALGVTLRGQEKWEEAENALRRALAIEEAAHGPDHRTVAFTLHELGVTLRNQERWEESENVLRRALAIREAVHGPDHRTVAGTLYEL
ncbi:MAG: tetratricopeptide repeat protein, partial [Bryobacterales bacterium]|nr:tetratricopeptide repeat protein [Bryobacterales bacterium]